MCRRAFIASSFCGKRALCDTFYNYFPKQKRIPASRLVDRQFEALHESLSRTGRSASHQLKEHCGFLALEPTAVEVAPLQLLATPCCGGDQQFPLPLRDASPAAQKSGSLMSAM